MAANKTNATGKKETHIYVVAANFAEHLRFIMGSRRIKLLEHFLEPATKWYAVRFWNPFAKADQVTNRDGIRIKLFLYNFEATCGLFFSVHCFTLRAIKSKSNAISLHISNHFILTEMYLRFDINISLRSQFYWSARERPKRKLGGEYNSRGAMHYIWSHWCWYLYQHTC